MVALGCGDGSETKENPFETAKEELVAPNPMTMLVVGDAELGKRIARQWSARRDGVLTIVNRSAIEFASSDFELPSEVDLVVYPPVMMPELIVRNQISPMPKEFWNSDLLNKNELLQHFRMSIVRYSGKPWAVPLGSPNFSMICNRKIFEQINLPPPSTWEKLEQSLETIETELNAAHESTSSDTRPLVAKVDMPLAAGWAAPTFLARVAPAIRHRRKLTTVFDRSTMVPLIVSPPFIDALEQLKSIATQRSLDLHPNEVYQLAVSGGSTIALTWPARGFSPTATLSNADDDSDADSASGEGGDQDGTDGLLIKALPGMPMWFDQKTQSWVERSSSEDVHVDLLGFSGMIASVSYRTSYDHAAWELLEWLSSKSISILTLVDSPSVGPFRASHLGDVSLWTGDKISLDVAEGFADVVAQNHLRSLIFIFPKIPGSQRYFDALDESIREFMAGAGTAKDALEKTAVQWEAITDSLGRQQQILGLRKQSGF